MTLHAGPGLAGVLEWADRKAVHVPDRHRAIVVLQHDIGLAVLVEIDKRENNDPTPGQTLKNEFWLLY